LLRNLTLLLSNSSLGNVAQPLLLLLLLLMMMMMMMIGGGGGGGGGGINMRSKAGG